MLTQGDEVEVQVLSQGLGGGAPEAVRRIGGR
jgi:hypothetical protein